MTKPQQRGAETETEKGERAPRSWSIDHHAHLMIWHSQPFHGVTCVRGCNLLTGPRNIVAEISPLDLYAHPGHRAWFRTSTSQKRALSTRMPAVDRQGGGRLSFEGDILADGGSWHTRESSKSIFSTMTTFPVTVNG